MSVRGTTRDSPWTWPFGARPKERLRLRVVREVAGDLLSAVEEDHFGCEVAAGAPVVDDEAVDTDEQLDRLEVKVRIPLETRGEIGAQRVLPDDSAVVAPGQPRNERRRHLDLIGVVVEDRVEVGRVPRRVPLLGETLSALIVERHVSSVRQGRPT